ncbi:UbiA family prenyltransferase [Natrinema gelatinilyticum]|uniref:UbiA family prenyltransferase n=1 Tax=Natrinema gelatinilyticum TaxID=2961571 RepID=UPI0020C4ED23|nr:UbiA family prenyltransferase [Natrinema gelatinilyticum]
MHERSRRSRLRRTTRGLAAHVQLVFFLPGVAMSFFGALLAGDVTVSTAAVHGLAIGLAIYVAHLKDGYVDYYVREEDLDNPLSPTEIRAAIGVSSATFVSCVAFLWATTGTVPAALTAPLVVLGLLHAPHLDAAPATGVLDYPLGISLAIAGGYATQTGALSAQVIAIAAVFLPLLAGINVLLDLLDYDHDRRVPKRTIPVVVGPDAARPVAWAFVVAAVALLIFSSALGILPPQAALAGVFPLGAAVACVMGGLATDRAVSLFIGSTYLFAAALFFALRPGLLP